MSNDTDHQSSVTRCTFQKNKDRNFTTPKAQKLAKCYIIVKGAEQHTDVTVTVASIWLFVLLYQ